MHQFDDGTFRLVVGTTVIDYDPTKEQANLDKHGYSLGKAVELLEKLLLPIGPAPPFATTAAYARNGELRHNHIAVTSDGKVVQIVTTMRKPEIVRVISLRPASRSERKILASLTGFRGDG